MLLWYIERVSKIYFWDFGNNMTLAYGTIYLKDLQTNICELRLPF